MPDPSTADVRAWARDRGLPVGDRGRLSPDLVAAYLAQQPSPEQSSPRQSSAQHPPPERREAAAPANRPGPATGTRGGRPAAGPAGRVVHARTPWNWPVLQDRAASSPRRGRGSA